MIKNVSIIVSLNSLMIIGMNIRMIKRKLIIMEENVSDEREREKIIMMI
jgi:hypothetical protein